MVIVQASFTETARATCDPDESLTGGGLLANGWNGVNEFNSDIESRAESSSTWMVRAHNYGPWTLSILAYAECSKLVDAP